MRPRMDGGGNDPRRGPRFNIYWVWGALAVILLGFNLFSSFTPDAKRINFDVFKEMLAKGDVAKIGIIGMGKGGFGGILSNYQSNIDDIKLGDVQYWM